MWRASTPSRRRVIGNAAHAAAGMALNAVPAMVSEAKRAVGLTMFGVTTPCITQIRQLIEADCECFVFHATGTGGQCLEKLIDSGLITAALDITTTEVADHLFGGVLACTDDRFGSVIRTPHSLGGFGGCGGHGELRRARHRACAVRRRGTSMSTTRR